jgi:hypothetical protein
MFVLVRSVAYVPISCLPHMAIMCHHERGSKDFFAHTLRHLLVEDVHFLSLGPLGWTFFGWTWKRTLWRARRYAGCHGCSWATMRVYFAREKNELTINTYATSNRFFLFFTYPNACMRAQQPNHFVFQNVYKLLLHTWAFRIWPPIDQKVIFEHLFLHFNRRPDLKS